MKKMLELFYAVTFTSLYLIYAERDKRGIPVVKKIAKKSSSKIPIGDRLKGGYNIGIMDDRIILFNPARNDRDPDMASIDHWGGSTSPIVGLFLDRKDAWQCLKAGSQKMWDSEYEEKSREVLRAIGKNHSVIVISHSVPIKN